MEKLEFRTIRNIDDTELVLDKIESNLGVRLPTDYANRSKIVGVCQWKISKYGLTVLRTYYG